MESFIYVVLFVVTVGSACIVAFSSNLIYSAFALIGTFMGVAGTFVFLNSTFLGLAQVVVYAGGILILTIFAVMLTSKIQQSTQSNPVFNYKAVVPLILLFMILLLKIVSSQTWSIKLSELTDRADIVELGNKLLTDYLLPFELISVVLLVAMLGAAIISRRKIR